MISHTKFLRTLAGIEAEDKDHRSSTLIFGIAFWLGIAGLLSILVYAILLITGGYIRPTKIDAQVSGTVGDFIGGFVGSLWAFAGILLFFLALRFQKREFMLQRSEFKAHKVEFQMTRATNTIYKQVELFSGLEIKLSALRDMSLNHFNLDEIEKYVDGLSSLFLISISLINDIDHNLIEEEHDRRRARSQLASIVIFNLDGNLAGLLNTKINHINTSIKGVSELYAVQTEQMEQTTYLTSIRQKVEKALDQMDYLIENSGDLLVSQHQSPG